MKRLSLLLALMLCTSVCFAETEWTPPELTEKILAEKPYLYVLKIAQEEIGYVEGPGKNESKYGEWFCGRRVAWCAEFLTWCVNEAGLRYGIDLMDIVYPYYGETSQGAPWFIQKGRFISAIGRLPTNEKQWLIGQDDYMKSGDYIPEPGDYLWIYYYSRAKGPDHVAIVEGTSVDDDGHVIIHVIEGNNPDRVQRNTYRLDYKKIYGFGTPVKRAMSNLRLYQYSDDVTELERALEKLGFLDMQSTYTTRMTSDIVAAVKNFNREYDLPGDRVADISTWAKIEELLGQ